MQAVMQTSRDLRLLASSLVSSIEIRDAFALNHYPKHAAAITSMHLRMGPSPGQAPMEPCCMVTWLQSTSTACNRLAAITNIRVELPQSSEEHGEPAEPMDPAVMDSLMASIGRACPNLRRLRIDCIDRDQEDLIRAMFNAIGRHLPRIFEMQLELQLYEDGDFNIAGIDWAACLPRGLQKFRGSVRLHHELLQQLVQMPSLAEVVVWSLGDEATEVKSDGCMWRILRIEDFQTWRSFSRFAAAMPLLQLYINNAVGWELDATRQAEGLAVAKAAAWLSQISNCPKELFIGWEINKIPDATSTVGCISALAPLSSLVSLELLDWPVTERTLDELALALPNVSKLTLDSCFVSSGAWLRMLSLTSVTDLTIIQHTRNAPALDGRGVSKTISLAQIIAFASAVLHPMTLNFNRGFVSDADWEDWEIFKETVNEQRQVGGLPQVTVRIVDFSVTTS